MRRVEGLAERIERGAAQPGRVERHLDLEGLPDVADIGAEREAIGPDGRADVIEPAARLRFQPRALRGQLGRVTAPSGRWIVRT